MKNEMKYAIGNRIRECRKSRKISQEQLAEAIDVACNTVSNIETGNRSTTLETVVKIAEIFEVSLDYLVLGVESTRSVLLHDFYIRRYIRRPKEDQHKMNIVLNTFFPEKV